MNIRSTDVEKISSELRRRLKEAVSKLKFDGTTLSGGLDTSVINYVASKIDNVVSITVGFEESPMEDLKYAGIVSNTLDLENHVRTFDFEEAKEAAVEVVRITRSFDPVEVRNDVTIFIAMKEAKKLGMNCILTGDGGDELFAGYPYLYNMPLAEMQRELKRIWKVMRFSSRSIAQSLGLGVEYPFLQEEFKEFAMNIRSELKVGEGNGRIGKWILRKAYDGKLPDEIIWRKKVPIEVGSGTTILREKFRSNVNFEVESGKVKRRDGVILRSGEQFFYYQIYKSIFGPPAPKDPKSRTCPYCRINVPERARFCRTCGNRIKEGKNGSEKRKEK